MSAVIASAKDVHKSDRNEIRPEIAIFRRSPFCPSASEFLGVLDGRHTLFGFFNVIWRSSQTMALPGLQAD
jgi:hypothetical protein